MLFLYNSGARAEEAAQVLINEVDLPGYSIKIRGKGGKERQCPLWPSTLETLRPLIVNRPPAARVFLNRCGHPLTRFGIYAMVERYVLGVQSQMPSLAAKRVSPHSIRHASAYYTTFQSSFILKAIGLDQAELTAVYGRNGRLALVPARLANQDPFGR